MYYVYRYMHPDYPWLYVGKTEFLINRIRCHDSSKDDNIDRKYEKLLRESSVYFMELQNSAQMSMVELYLIDKYKPFLNRKDKFDGESDFEIKLPEWQRFPRKYDFNQKNNSINKSLRKHIEKLRESVEGKKNELLSVKDALDKELKSCDFSLEENKRLLQEIRLKSGISNDVSLSVDIETVKTILKEFPDADIVFKNIVETNFDGITEKTISRNGLEISHNGSIENIPLDAWAFELICECKVINSFFCGYAGCAAIKSYIEKTIRKYKEQLKFLEKPKTASIEEIYDLINTCPDVFPRWFSSDDGKYEIHIGKNDAEESEWDMVDFHGEEFVEDNITVLNKNNPIFDDFADCEASGNKRCVLNTEKLFDSFCDKLDSIVWIVDGHNFKEKREAVIELQRKLDEINKIIDNNGNNGTSVFSIGRLCGIS